MARKRRGKGPQFVHFFGTVLEALQDLGGSDHPAEVVDWVASKMCRICGKCLANSDEHLPSQGAGNTGETDVVFIDGELMEIDWDRVKKKTLWHYEDLIKKMLDALAYGFVQEHYNHTLEEAESFSERIRQGYLQNGKEAAFAGFCLSSFICGN